MPNAKPDRDASLRAAIADAVVAGDDDRVRGLLALLTPTRPALRRVK